MKDRSKERTVHRLLKCRWAKPEDVVSAAQDARKLTGHTWGYERDSDNMYKLTLAKAEIPSEPGLVTELDFNVKNVYGRDLFYPQNKQAQLAAKLIGKKTLTTEQVKVLIEMGFDVIQKPVEVNLNKK